MLCIICYIFSEFHAGEISTILKRFFLQKSYVFHRYVLRYKFKASNILYTFKYSIVVNDFCLAELRYN